MKLHLADFGAQQAITGYGAGYVLVGGVRHERSLVVLPERVIADWGVAGFEHLAPEHFARLAELAPDILLLGTGAQLRFPAPALLAPLVAARIGLEVMDTPAACRTYNILLAEGRKVAAALLLR